MVDESDLSLTLLLSVFYEPAWQYQNQPVWGMIVTQLRNVVLTIGKLATDHVFYKWRCVSNAENVPGLRVMLPRQPAPSLLPTQTAS